METVIMPIFFIFFILIAIATLIFWVMALVDIVNSQWNGDDKIIWILIVVFGGIIGVILYYAVGRKKKIEEKVDDGVIDIDDINFK